MIESLSKQAQRDVESDIEESMYKDWENLLLLASGEPVKVNGRPLSVRSRTSPEGRLEKLGLSPQSANWLRNRIGRTFPHPSGFDEWPGSQPVNSIDIPKVEQCLRDIEAEAAIQIYRK